MKASERDMVTKTSESSAEEIAQTVVRAKKNGTLKDLISVLETRIKKSDDASLEVVWRMFHEENPHIHKKKNSDFEFYRDIEAIGFVLLELLKSYIT